jgi:hypothetical protein
MMHPLGVKRLLGELRRPRPLPRLRLSLRTAIVLVAVAGLGLGVTILSRRARSYEALATYHETQERRWRDVQQSHQEQAVLIDQDRGAYQDRLAHGQALLTPEQYEAWLDEHASMVREAKARAADHARLKTLFQTLAREPWKPEPGTAAK